MKKKIFLFLLLFNSFFVLGQVSINVDAEGINTNNNLILSNPNSSNLYTGSFTAQGSSSDNSSANLNFSFIPNSIGGATDVLLNVFQNGIAGPFYTWTDYLASVIPGIETSQHLGKISGSVESYIAGSGTSFNFTKTFSGDISYVEGLIVTAEENTIIELPLIVSATFVSGQTFANNGIDPLTSDTMSMAIAEAKIVGQIGNQEINVGKKVVWAGSDLGLVQNSEVEESIIISIPVQEGINEYSFSITGTISATSKLIPLSFIPAAINTGTIAGNSVIIGHFTGENGQPLPEGLSIMGMESGISYSNYSNALYNSTFIQNNTINNLDISIKNNPITINSSINVSNPKSETVDITILNLNGNIFYHKCSNMKNIVLSSILSELPPSVYLVQVKSESKSIVKKMIKI